MNIGVKSLKIHIWTASLAEYTTCLTTNKEIAGLIPGTSPIFKMVQDSLTS